MIVLYFAPVSAASVGHRISGSGVVEGCMICGKVGDRMRAGAGLCLFCFFRRTQGKEAALGGVICTPSVPIVAQGLPVVDASICERICAVVVFPFVPVIPMIWRSRSVRIDKYLQHRESA